MKPFAAKLRTMTSHTRSGRDERAQLRTRRVEVAGRGERADAHGLKVSPLPAEPRAPRRYPASAASACPAINASTARLKPPNPSVASSKWRARRAGRRCDRRGRRRGRPGPRITAFRADHEHRGGHDPARIAARGLARVECREQAARERRAGSGERLGHCRPHLCTRHHVRLHRGNRHRARDRHGSMQKSPVAAATEPSAETTPT